MLLGEKDPDQRRREKEAPLLKRRYFTAIGLSSVKMVADRPSFMDYYFIITINRTLYSTLS